MTQIPIYRAKKVDSDEYVIGELHTLGTDEEPFITTEINDRFIDHIIIDPTTLSIHFPDMLDSQGDKIFASLSEDGKGGDIFEHSVSCRLDTPRPHDGTYWVHCKSPLIYKDFTFYLKYKIEDFTPQFCNHKISNRAGFREFEKSLKTIGIQQ